MATKGKPKKMKKKIDDISEMLNRSLNRIEIQVTWRFIFYIIYILVVWLLVSLAIADHYEHRIIMFAIWLMFTLSYPISVFLIKYKEVD